jgi:transcription-repair coupling factor (superfamily II helicase)
VLCRQNRQHRDDTIGTPVLIPEDYVADLSVCLNLYRRLADLEDEREIDASR